MRVFLLFCCIPFLCSIFPLMTQAQTLQDDFTDGDFTNNPTWQGDVGDFIVNGSNQLQLNNLGVSAESELYLAANIQDSTFWEFYVQMDFAPSTSNRTRVYLQSDNSNLSSTTNGYYVHLGGSGATDSIELFRVDGGTPTKLIGGTAGAIANNPTVRVRVIRSSTNEWTLFADYAGTTTFINEGSMIDPAPHTSGSFFGIWCDYTTTRGDQFFFDDFYLSPLFVDIIPPVIDTIIAVNATQVDVYFDEAVDATTANVAGNYSIDNGISVTNAQKDGTDPKLVHLTTSTMTSLTTYLTTITTVEDLNGNPITSANKSYVYYNVQPVTAQDIIINEIFADPTPQVGLPNAEYVELLNRSNNIIDLNGLDFDDGSLHSLPSHLLLPDSTVILCSNSNTGLFSGDVIGIGTMGLSNGGEQLALKDGATDIDILTYDLSWYQDVVKDDGGWSLELINPNLLCQGSTNWIASTDVSGGTPNAENSVYNNTPDLTGPSLLSASFINGTQITLIFDEALDAATANNPANYTVVGFTVTGASFSAPDTVVITLNSAMVDLTNYTVNVLAGLTDCSGNPVGAANNASFTYYNIQAAAAQDILINEIFADPTPQIGLPNAEYLELYNNSSKTIDLASLTIDEGSPQALPTFYLIPNSYVTVCANSNTALFSGFGDVVGVPSLSLSNGGEALILKTNTNVTVDSVEYASSWYQDAVKDDGGWSLELINPNLTCQGELNWIASTNVSGGTPGTQNSVFNNAPDATGPSLLSATFLSGTQIELTFDEVLDLAAASNIANYTLAGFTITNAVYLAPDKVILTLNNSMVDLTNYTVNALAGLTDCSGNPVGAANSTSFTYYDLQPATAQDIIFNEIFADPAPIVGLPDAEYLELYNRSSKTINLATLELDEGSVQTLPQHYLIPNSYVIICKTSELAKFAAYTNVISLSSLSLSNAGEELVLKTLTGTTIDSIEYSNDWYQDAVKDDGGWSLELINPNLLCQGGLNWAASTDASGGTPDAQNSVFDNTPDVTGPAALSANFTSSTEIQIEFDETLDPTAAANPANYSIAGFTTTGAVFQAPSTVTITVNIAMTDQTNYTVNVANGLTDCSGNAIGAANNVSFTYYDIQPATAQDIIFNEIFADPAPIVGLPDTEYLELYNRSSNTIDLATLELDEGSLQTLPQYYLTPNSYVIICKTSELTKFAAYTNVISLSSLSLSNSGEELVLRTLAGTAIDSIEYSSSWYQDAVKDDGGWSLELINPNLLCQGGLNWAASTDVSGGTPDAQNSVFDNTPDATGPSILSADFISPTQITLIFDEVLDATTANNTANYSITGFTITAANYLAPDTVIITINNPMVDQTNYTVNIANGLTDCSGNAVGATNNASFTYYDIQPATAQDIIFNEVFADYSPVVGLPQAEYLELYNRSSNTIDLSTLVLNEGSDQNLSSYFLTAGSYVLIAKTSQLDSFVAYNNVIGVNSLSLSNNGEELVLKTLTGTIIDSIEYSSSWYQDVAKDDGGWSLELINPSALCQGSANWIASTNSTGGTPAGQNSVYNNTPDIVGPSVLSANFISSTQVQLEFDETIDGATAINTANYSITGFSVSGAIFQEPSTVILTLNTTMVNQTNYTVVVANGLQDCSGNAVGANNNASFTYLDIQTAAFQDIIFNEIFADENPQVGLPPVEYLELYNRSSKTIDLATLELDEGSTKPLPSFFLQPNSYVIVCAASKKDSFISYGDVVGISSFSLSNGGETIVLRSQTGTLIDSLAYSSAWYQDFAKDDGGWSLELMNPNLICKGGLNWIASNDMRGGTPCTQNSVYSNTPDTTKPNMLSAEFTDSVTVLLLFDEPLGATSSNTVGNYTINGVTFTNAAFHAPDSVILTTSSNMVDLKIYTVTANVNDCSGNAIATNSGSFTYYQIQTPAFQEIIFNELMLDPTPVVGLPNKEYIELYNTSNKAFDLSGYTLAHTSTGTSSIVSTTLPKYILGPNEFVLLIDDSDEADFLNYNNRLAVDGLPALNNTGARLQLIDAFTSLDDITYSNEWYGNPDKDDGGNSLELINPNHLCKQGGNWRVSISGLGGTPGGLNSVYTTLPDLTKPLVTRVKTPSNTTIDIQFDKNVDAASATTITNYTSVGVSIVNIALLANNEVRLTLNSAIAVNSSIDLTLQNTDCLGNAVDTTITVSYYNLEVAKHYDILINEIFADTDPVIGLPEFEYVELYNRSNKYINLEGFTFKDKSSKLDTLPYFVLKPESYVLISSVGSKAALGSFGDVIELGVFPDLNVSADYALLRDGAGNVIDGVSYEDDWYGNGDKAAGGWSLERINPNSPCEGIDNWRASEALIGGTPNSANSILQTTPDDLAPSVLRAFPFYADSVRLYLSEAVHDTNSLYSFNYTIDNGMTVTGAYVEPPFYNTVVVGLNTLMTKGVTYTLTLNSGFTDCIGNQIGVNNEVQFALPEDIEKGDIVLNEVLFNPVSGGSDFIELYNNSNKIVNAGDLILANLDDLGFIYQVEPVITDWLIFPQEYVAISKDIIQVKDQYTTPNPDNFIQNNLPSMGDKEGSIFIYTVNSFIQATPIDSLSYTSNFHTPLLDDENGVSLERIDFNAPTQDPNNWHSASTDVGYATPAYQNSSFMANEIVGDDILQLPKTTFSPDGDGYEDFLLINYNTDALGYVANIDVYDAHGRMVRRLVNGELLADEGTFQWDGARDDGTKARIGIYIILAEIYNDNGDRKRFKKTCVVAGQLRK
ncbi:MAG: hypothetical protein GY810_03230 [Aureispira sp.]|nr:hypothetical protein [Aureispira sp.]